MLSLLSRFILSSPSALSSLTAAYSALTSASLPPLPQQNLLILFSLLGVSLFTSHSFSSLASRILSDPLRLNFFRLAVPFYLDGPEPVLDSIFYEALSVQDVAVIRPLVSVLRYGEKFIRWLYEIEVSNKLADDCDAITFTINSSTLTEMTEQPEDDLRVSSRITDHLALIAALLDFLDPSFYVLFFRPVLRSLASSRGLLSRITPLLHYTPSQSLSPDLLSLISSERAELSILLDPSRMPTYTLNCSINCELRDYQLAGIRWLAYLSRFHLNGILADDMGLGKTVQLLAFILSEMSVRPGTRSLVLCPSSLLSHWREEALLYFGCAAGIFSAKSGMPDSSLVIASYDTLRRNPPNLNTSGWFAILFDEGHILRNRTTSLYQRAALLCADHKFILTGTPIHNSVLDLFALFNLIMPGYLGTESEFTAEYACKITEKNVDGMEKRLAQLQKRVLPFIMRRLKSEVLPNLPPKIIKDVMVDLTGAHRDLYNRVSGADADQLGMDQAALSYVTIRQSSLERTTALLNAVAHPRFFGISAPSAKSAALRDIFAMCEGRKVLVFFQHRRAIEYVIDELKLTNYMRLDGSIPPAERGNIATRFNSGTAPYLFLTTAVGGLGLNLTSADTVVFYEHDWNPFNDLQAMDRAHRLGQKRAVNVFRLIARGTIEEKVMSYQSFKLFVANSLVTQQNREVEQMETNDMLERLQQNE